MKTDFDVPITVDDGVVFRADVYRPDEGQHPVLLSYLTSPTRLDSGWPT